MINVRKYRSIFSVTSKSAMTPSFIGRTAITPSGVRPNMRLASSPTPLIFFVSRSIATTDGSLRTIPSPFTYTRVLAVPRSTPMAFAGNRDPDFPKNEGQRIAYKVLRLQELGNELRRIFELHAEGVGDTLVGHLPLGHVQAL